MKLFVVCSFILSALPLFANTQLQCDPLKKEVEHERFLISLDDSQRLVQMEDIRWNDLLNQQASSGTGTYLSSPTNLPVAFEAEEGHRIYSFQIKEEGCVDSEPHLTDVMLMLSQNNVGPAQVQISDDNGNQGSDVYDLDCSEVNK